MTLSRFFKTPKGVLIIVLGVLLGPAVWRSGLASVGPGVASASLAGMLVDVPILRVREGEWQFPSGALLTGLLVAMVMSPLVPWWVFGATAGIGVASKYVIRSGRANVFNPAALALVATFYMFDTAQNWWGALPDLPTWTLALLFAAGIFMADRVNKMPGVLAFLGTYYLLITVTAFVGDPGSVAELYRAPDLHAALFFAFFMVTDPPTSPPKPRDQLIYGAITGVVSFGVFELLGAVYYLLAGLLVANVWEAWRRRRLKGRAAEA